MEQAHLVCFCTCPNREAAERIAETLVEEGHAACVNIVPGLTSVYRWQGKVQRDEELLLVIKTSAAAYARLEVAIQTLHPYELPEIIAVPIERGLDGYVRWIGEQTQRDD